MLEQPDIKQKLGPLLRELGLKENEIDLYTYALALGPVAIPVLAECLGISPPNVYKLIAGLEAHGLTQFSKRKRYGRLFVVESPDVLRTKLDHKRREIGEMAHLFQESLPDLLANYYQGSAPMKIRVLEPGPQVVDAFRRVFDDAKKEVLFCGSIDHFVELMGEEEAYFKSVEERISRGVKIKGLVFPGKYADWMMARPPSDGRETRILKTANPFITSFQSSTRTALIMQPKVPMVLLIEDQFIVEMFRSIFLMLWERAR